jgi:hypothetical protein
MNSGPRIFDNSKLEAITPPNSTPLPYFPFARYSTMKKIFASTQAARLDFMDKGRELR